MAQARMPRSQRPRISGIYLITNPKGRVYVGQSIDCFKRFDAYRNLQCKGQTKLYRSLVKYGWENHSVQIAAIGEPKYLDEMEIVLIKLADSVANGLNLRLGGSRSSFSKETRLRMSHAAKVKMFSQEHREAMRKAQTGRTHPDTVKKKIGAAQKGELNHHFGSGCAVLQKDFSGTVIRRFASAHHVMVETGIPQQMIQACCRRNAGLMPWGCRPRVGPPQKKLGTYQSQGYIWLYD